MLPPKIGDGVVGSSSGGVKPTGASASFVGATVFSSAAEILMGLDATVERVSDLGAMKVEVTDCFHGAEAVGVKRVA